MIQDIEFEISQKTLEALDNITEERFKYLVSKSINLKPSEICIKEIDNVVYYHNNGIISYNTQDDIYTNGCIKESEFGKMIKDFTTAIIIKRNLNMPKDLNVVGIDIIFNSNSGKSIKELKRTFILKYLGVLEILINPYQVR